MKSSTGVEKAATTGKSVRILDHQGNNHAVGIVVPQPDAVWAVDFMSDNLYGGRRFRILNILDKGVEAEETSEVGGKFGGPCRGRTYGPLIKREKEPFLIRLAVATVSPNWL